MSDKAGTSCWLVDFWRKTKMTPSVINQLQGGEEAHDYLEQSRQAQVKGSRPRHQAPRKFVIDSNPTVIGKPHYAGSRQWGSHDGVGQEESHDPPPAKVTPQS